MIDKYTQIRPIVLGIVKKDGKLLVEKGYDSKKDEVFFRPLGGGIEFLEKSVEALKREFLEELNIKINVKEFLGIDENIFEFNGRVAHELVFMYRAEINESDYKEKYHIKDDNGEFEALWINIEEFSNGNKILYPNKLLNIL